VNIKSLRCAVIILVSSLVCGCGEQEQKAASNKVTQPINHKVVEWRNYGSAEGGGHYSAASQINSGNVQELEQAWVYRSGDAVQPNSFKVELANGDHIDTPGSSWQLTPLFVNGRVYGCSQRNRVFALDPLNGRELWSYDPGVDIKTEVLINCRGVASWQEAEYGGGPCKHRIFSATLDGRLIALDGSDGKLCTDFGEVDLGRGLGKYEQFEYSVTSPPLVIGDVVIVGSMIMDRVHNHMPSGVVRAFDVRTGEARWSWQATPPNWPQDGESFLPGTPNVWSMMSSDSDRDLLFLPTGNPSTDFYGGLRDGIDHYGSSVLALRASTGELVWHYKLVEHDVWDYDTPSQPTLFELERGGERIPALAQPTKMGMLFILNRETGEALYPVEKRRVSNKGVSGEILSSRQKFTLVPKPLHPHSLSSDEAFGFTPWDRGACRKKIGALRNEGIYTPPSLEGSMFFPSDFGGNNWGSPAIDPERGIAILNTRYVSAELKLVERAQCKSGKITMQPQYGTPYCVQVEPLLSPLGVPCNPPPWGTLTAVDLNTGEHLWQRPLGTLKNLAPWPFSLIEGAPNVGGAMVTAGRITFIAATTDSYFRAFDTATGAELWSVKLPTSGNATPMSYVAEDGRQYVLIAAAGHFGLSAMGVETSDFLIAFALPSEEK